MGALADARFRLVESVEDAMAFKRWLGERRPVLGVDTETGGLHWWRDALRLVQFGDARTGWAIPWGDWAGLVKEALTDYDGDFVAHNAKFDLHFLEHNGCTVPRERLHDTSVMAHILDPNRSRKLKDLGKTLVDPASTTGQDALLEGMAKHRWTWATVPTHFSPYWIYAALDPVITAHLYEHFRPSMAQYAGVYDLEMGVSWACADMERRGVRVDLDYAQAKHDELSAYIDRATEWCRQRHGFKPGQNQAVAAALVAEGLPLTKLTDKGALSVDEEVLAGLAGRSELAAVVLQVRQATKVRKSYFHRILELADGDVVHASINPLGARTARMSVSAPPLQQLPSDSPLVRDAFFVDATIDFDQIEVRLLAHFAQEESMIDAIRSGVDLHWHSARRMYGPDATAEQRKRSKSGTFGKIYGIGVDKFASQQGVTREEAQAFLRLYDETFPGVPRFIKQVEDVARARLGSDGQAWVATPLGRRHRVPRYDDAFYKLVNYLIQGTAADVLKQKIVALDAAGLGDYMVLPVHDEILWDTGGDAARAAEVAREAAALMQDREQFVVPLTVESKLCATGRWGDPYRSET